MTENSITRAWEKKQKTQPAIDSNGRVVDGSEKRAQKLEEELNPPVGSQNVDPEEFFKNLPNG